MKKIIAMAGSNSSKSINKKLVSYAAMKLKDLDAKIIDLRDFAMPLYSIDLEEEKGVPDTAVEFSEMIQDADGIIISFAEHNGAYSVAFKNVFDWASRHNHKTWAGKPVLLMATSPGKRGGSGMLSIAQKSFPHFGAKVTGSFSLPQFNDSFKEGEGILEQERNNQLTETLAAFTQVVLNRVEQDSA